MAISTIKKKIYYHDTDCGGVVYYANYLKFFEEARTEHFCGTGIDLQTLSAKGSFFVVSSVEIKYKSSANYGDELVILSLIEKIGVASIVFSHEIKRGQSLLVKCKTTLV